MTATVGARKKEEKKREGSRGKGAQWEEVEEWSEG